MSTATRSSCSSVESSSTRGSLAAGAASSSLDLLVGVGFGVGVGVGSMILEDALSLARAKVTGDNP